MLALMLWMTLLGLALLWTGALLCAAPRSGGSDPVPIARMLQALGVALLIGALLVRPHNPETAAFPPPERVAETGR